MKNCLKGEVGLLSLIVGLKGKMSIPGHYGFYCLAKCAGTPPRVFIALGLLKISRRFLQPRLEDTCENH